MLEINQIHHGDCLELMHEIPDGSVDMVLCDLPYGTTSCSWDSIIPLEPLWAHYKRIVKQSGAIVLTAAQPFTTVLAYSNLEWLRDEWIWEKDNASNANQAKKGPMRYHENVLVFSAIQPVYNPQMWDAGKPTNKRGSRPRNLVAGREKGYTGQQVFTNLRYPKSVQRFNRPKHNNGAIHETQKPVALFAYLIRTYSNPGDLVLDNAAGSGTTAIAAIQTGRNWLCIEKDAEIYATAANRIAKAMGQGFTPAARAGQPNNQNQAELLQRGLWE